ncbi:MAG TPA: hypothetical protein VHZ73_00395 [Vicinamibacterales bacterium]|nr:hypothetical protein [Vicinamibacterales bacterium]
MRRVGMRTLGMAMLLVAVGAAPAAAQVGIGVKAGSEGLGVDVAVPVASRVNIRAGVSTFTLNHDFDSDGITIAAQLKLSGVDAHLDLFPFGGSFHISPGFTIHNGTKVSGAAAVAGGQSFSLGDQSLVSDRTNPVTGAAAVAFKSTAPSLTMGFGNLVPRGTRRWSIGVEFGAMLSKQPTATLTLAGNACASNGTNCRPIATDPTLQSDLASQVAKINKDLEPLKALPIFQMGFGYRFGK